MSKNEKEFIDTIEYAEGGLGKILANMFNKLGGPGVDSVAASHAKIAYGLILAAQNHLNIADTISERVVFEREKK